MNSSLGLTKVINNSICNSLGSAWPAEEKASSHSINVFGLAIIHTVAFLVNNLRKECEGTKTKQKKHCDGCSCC